MAVVSDSFNERLVRQILEAECRFINNLFEILPVQVAINTEDTEKTEDILEDKKQKPIFAKENGTTRAQSLDELKNRLDALKNRLGEFKNKKNMTYKDKCLKKSLKNKITKKGKREERISKQKLLRAQKSEQDNVQNEKTEIEESPTKKFKQPKPVFNSAGKMVFSKFDFCSKKPRKDEKDPQKMLQILEKRKTKLKALEDSGEKEKAIELKEKIAWKTALAKADGQKVKDDPELLKKTVKKREQQVKQSKKKWQAREENVNKAKEQRQTKRLENINKKKKENKMKKLKTAAKKGKIIPGF